MNNLIAHLMAAVLPHHDNLGGKTGYASVETHIPASRVKIDCCRN